TFYQSRGKLRASAIEPMGRCKAGTIPVPCPRRPMETLRAMLPPGSNASCLALPDVESRKNRGKHESDRDDWLSEGLTREDVDILRARAADLNRQGFMSMLPYIDFCWNPKDPNT
ncbi:unnamed protein product, partial [Symbiodinium pilosum]